MILFEGTCIVVSYHRTVEGGFMMNPVFFLKNKLIDLSIRLTILNMNIIIKSEGRFKGCF